MSVTIFNAHVTHGGVERQVHYLCNGLRNHDVSVALVAVDRIDGPYPVAASRRVRWPGLFERGFAKFIALPSVYRRLLVATRSLSTSVLHTWGPYENLLAALVAMRIRVPLVTSVRTNRPWAFKFIRLWGRVSRAIVVNADQVRNTLVSHFRVNPAKVVLIRNAISLERYPFRTPPPPGRPVRVCVIGRLSSSKNQVLLVRALPGLEQIAGRGGIEVRLVGADERTGYRERLESAIRESSSEATVRIDPYTSDVHEIYRSTDLLVLPSISEGLPNVLLEAMAMGTPWIASDIADNRWLAGVDRERGALFDPGSVASLVSAFRWYYESDQNALARRARAGRDFVESNFSVERMTSQFLALYQGVTT